MKDIDLAKALLKDDKTIVLVKDDQVLDSSRNGVKPLIGFLNDGIDVKGYSLADRIVGKAQAMLCAKAGIKEVFGKVMSYDGMAILEKYHIPYTYETLVEYIINRTGDDICPMEKTVQSIDDLEIAYQALNKKIAELDKLII